jgi:hypothetical protein
VHVRYYNERERLGAPGEPVRLDHVVDDVLL